MKSVPQLCQVGRRLRVATGQTLGSSEHEALYSQATRALCHQAGGAMSRSSDIVPVAQAGDKHSLQATYRHFDKCTSPIFAECFRSAATALQRKSPEPIWPGCAKSGNETVPVCFTSRSNRHARSLCSHSLPFNSMDCRPAYVRAVQLRLLQVLSASPWDNNISGSQSATACVLFHPVYISPRMPHQNTSCNVAWMNRICLKSAQEFWSGDPSFVD